MCHTHADLRARVQDRRSERHLLLLVEHGQQEDRTGEEGGFGETEEDSADRETDKVLYGAGKTGDQTPCGAHEADVCASANVNCKRVRRLTDSGVLDLGGNHVGRDLEADVTGKEHGDGGGIVLGRQVQVFLDTGDLGTSDVLPVEVVAAGQREQSVERNIGTHRM